MHILENFARTCVRVSVRFRKSVIGGVGFDFSETLFMKSLDTQKEDDMG